MTVKLSFTSLEIGNMDKYRKVMAMDLPDMIRKARLDRGLTLEDFGKLIGRSKQYMFLLENGRIRLSYETAVKIAKALGTKPDALFLR